MLELFGQTNSNLSVCCHHSTSYWACQAGGLRTQIPVPTAGLGWFVRRRRKGPRERRIPHPRHADTAPTHYRSQSRPATAGDPYQSRLGRQKCACAIPRGAAAQCGDCHRQRTVMMNIERLHVAATSSKQPIDQFETLIGTHWTLTQTSFFIFINNYHTHRLCFTLCLFTLYSHKYTHSCVTFA